jgi:hypothetical protein
MTAGTIMVLMLAVVFAGIGGAKVLAVPAARREARHLGFDVGRYRIIGAAELAAAGLAVGLVWVPVDVAARSGLVAMLVGAVVVLRRAGDPRRHAELA